MTNDVIFKFYININLYTKTVEKFDFSACIEYTRSHIKTI